MIWNECDRTETAADQLVIQAAESDMGVQENWAFRAPKTGAKMQAHQRKNENMLYKRQDDGLGRLRYQTYLSE